VGRGGMRSAGRLLLEALFPGRCLLCGQWLILRGDHPAPVCGDCIGGLSPILCERCVTCGMPLVSERGNCTRCRAAAFSFETNVAIFPYSGPARDLIGMLKFEGRRRLARLFADFAVRSMDGEREHLPVVPVPPRPSRREPDAVERVARSLADRHGRQVSRLLVRTGGAPQKSLSLTERRENLRGMIHIAPSTRGSALPPRVLLLDDVFTTGATLDECARTLREAGCFQVYALTLAIEE